MPAFRILVLVTVLAALFTTSASALDLETDFQPPPGEVGTPYTWEFYAEEGCVPYRFTYLNGTIPPGLQVTADGKLTGTPTLSGTFGFWVALNDNSGPQNPACIYPSLQSEGLYTMVVLPDLAVATTSLLTATPGRPYSAQLEFSNPEAGWPVIWDITQGALPSGLTLSQSGLISGTPAGPDAKTFVVRAREPFRRFGERQLTLTVGAALQARSALGVGEIGLRYAGAVSGSGGVPPLTYSVAIGSLPSGLALNATTGAVRGVPQVAGIFGLTFAVTDASGQQTTVPANLRVAARLTIRTGRLPAASVGSMYRARLSSTGGLAPKLWRVARGALPRGIRLNAANGRLTGTPRQAGVFRITVEARDRLGARSTKRLRLTVTG